VCEIREDYHCSQRKLWKSAKNVDDCEIFLIFIIEQDLKVWPSLGQEVNQSRSFKKFQNFKKSKFLKLFENSKKISKNFKKFQKNFKNFKNSNHSKKFKKIQKKSEKYRVTLQLTLKIQIDSEKINFCPYLESKIDPIF